MLGKVTLKKEVVFIVAAVRTLFSRFIHTYELVHPKEQELCDVDSLDVMSRAVTGFAGCNVVSYMREQMREDVADCNSY